MPFFSTGSGTPLYSSTWMPVSADNYAGTCIFLAVLGVIFRSLVALKSTLERRWIDAELNSRYTVVTENLAKKHVASQATRSLLREEGVEDDVIVVHRHINGVRPWRLTIDGPQAVIDTMIAGLLYLL